MSWMRDVYSSVVQQVGYEEESKALIVVWKSGKRSAYTGVPEELADQLANAASVGQMVNREIKPYYAHKYV